MLVGLAALGVPARWSRGCSRSASPALATRGMHLDGLADTADGLGCYGPPERALAVMRDGGAGPFAVVTLVVVVGAQAAALAALASARDRRGARPWRWPPRPGGPAFGWVCRRGVPAARPGRAGRDRRRVAAVVGRRRLVGGAGRRGLRARGPARRAGRRAGRAVVAALSWHTARRFGGMTGDVLGAASELATLTALVVLASR